MAKNIHLSLSDRIIIEAGLRERRSFSAIAAELGKDPTTISKEVRAHIKLNQAGGYNPCMIRKYCKHYGDLCHPCKFTYCRLFPIILTDRGSEFTDPVSIECTKLGEIRSRVFYCDPQRSDQKGGCEVTHEFIRRILPKGTSFDSLQQRDILLMMSHINSYTRKKLNNQSANRLFSFLYGETILPNLGIQDIPANDINLTPRLLKK